MDPVVTIVSTIVGIVVSGVIAWRQSASQTETSRVLLQEQVRSLHKEHQQKSEEIGRLSEEVAKLTPIVERYRRIREVLQSSHVVRSYYQPVVLVGPVGVGKTSLLMQWHAPWDHSGVQSTQTVRSSDVPIYEFMAPDTVPHFADETIQVPAHVHLGLRVYDFPGELSAQKRIRQTVVEETRRLRNETGKLLGIVLICMFDASETATGSTAQTERYYNGELFQELRSLHTHFQVQIQRIVIVFNKYDALRRHRPDGTDRELLNECLDHAAPHLRLLSGICNEERYCEVFTILTREQMAENNRGAPIVKGEAARDFVVALAGTAAADEIAPRMASRYAAKYVM